MSFGKRKPVLNRPNLRQKLALEFMKCIIPKVPTLSDHTIHAKVARGAVKYADALLEALNDKD